MKSLSQMPFAAIFVCILYLSFVAGCNQEQQKSALPSPADANDVIAKTKVLATISDDEQPHQQPYFHVVFNERGKGVAYVAAIAENYRIVHNGKAGRLVAGYDEIALSPDGQRIAYGAMVDGKWRMVIDDGAGVNSDEVGNPVFSPDSRHIAYGAKVGKKWHMVVDNWMSEGGRSHDGKPVFSGDSTKIAYVEKIDDKGQLRLIVSDLAFKTRNIKDFSGGQFLANRDKTRLAAVKESNKGQRVIEFSFDQPDAVKEGPLYDTISSLTFGADGVSVAYVAERGGKRYLALNGKGERLPDGAPAGPPVIRPDKKGASVIMNTTDGFFLHQAFFHDGTKKRKYEEAADLVYSGDSSLHAYAARKGERWFVVVNGKEGPAFDRVVSPVFSPDCRKLVYRARKDGRRFVVVADKNGKTIRQHSAYEQVFQPVFTSDGTSVAYGIKDGQKLIWKVEKL